MTTEEMRYEIERVFSQVLSVKKPSAKTNAAIPSTITPQSWHAEIPEAAETITREEFRVKYAGPAGETLAAQALDLGLDRFARLSVKDREAAQVRGHMKTHKRDRAFIVHALGWKGDAK